MSRRDANGVKFVVALVLGALFCLSPLSAKAQSPSGTDGEVLFGPLAPGWTENRPADANIRRYFLLSENDIVAAELLFFLESLPQGMSLEEYGTALQQNSLAAFEGYTAGEVRNATLQGAPVLIHDFLFSNQGKHLKARIFVLTRNNTGYVFLFDGLEEQFPTLAPKFDAFFFQTVSLGGTPQAQPVQIPTSQAAQLPGGAPLQSPAEVALPGTGGTAPGLGTSVAPQPEAGGAPSLPGVSPAETIATSPLPSPGEASSPDSLPALDAGGAGDLPPLGDLDEPGVFSSASGDFRIHLPDEAKQITRNSDSAEYAGPDDSRLRIIVLATPEEIGPVLDRESAEKRPHGTSTLSCGTIPCTTRLYSFRDAGSAANKALLLASWQRGRVLVAIELPADKYKSAGTWIRKFLCSAELQ